MNSLKPNAKDAINFSVSRQIVSILFSEPRRVFSRVLTQVTSSHVHKLSTYNIYIYGQLSEA